MMKTLGIAVLGLVIYLGFSADVGLAQLQNPAWSDPMRMSSLGANVVHQSGTIVTDDYGNAHLVWVESGFDDDRATIQYASYDGIAWSRPVDIYVAAPNTPLRGTQLSIDHENALHLTWTRGLNSKVSYMTAPATRAIEQTAQVWSAPIEINVEAFQARLERTPDGILHLIYSKYQGQEKGIFYTRSIDDGGTWSESLWLDPDIPVNFAPQTLKVGQDANGGLHAVWLYSDPNDSGIPGKWVRYSHSIDGGITWSLPTTIDEESPDGSHAVERADPVLAMTASGIEIIWARSTEAGSVRYRRYSSDYGMTWTDAESIVSYGTLNGQAGDDTAIDSTGTLHYFSQIRYPQGIYHGTEINQEWITPELIYLIRENSQVDYSGIHAHHLRAATRLGNELVLSFTNSPGDGDLSLYVMHTTLEDALALEAKPLPSVPGISPTPQPTVKSATRVALEPPTATPVVIGAHTGLGEGDTGSVNGLTRVPPLVAGIAPAIMLIILVVGLRQMRT